MDWWYDVRVVSEAPGQPLRMCGGVSMVAEHGLDALAAADTVIVPCWPTDVAPSDELVAALRSAKERGGRLVSICSGAFLLAAAGLLDGRDVATHWRYGWWSPRIATAARRKSIDRPVGGGDLLRQAMEWALGRLEQPIRVEDLARRAFMSPRTFSRRLSAATGTSPLRWLVATGTSPLRWLVEQRIAASLPLLEATSHPVEHVASLVGFPQPVSYRHHFGRTMRTSPSAYRKAVRTTAPAPGADEAAGRRAL